MNIHIKNMVCNRCIMAVEKVLDNLGVSYKKVTLGEVELNAALSYELTMQLKNELLELGFELIDDRKSRIIEQIKNLIILHVHHSDEPLKINISDFIISKMNFDYKYLSALFSEVEGTTIEKYFIAQRIEKVKELLVYDELTLNQIADKLGYSSTAYLSNQFKKITGLTPIHFRKVKEMKRKPIDEV